MRKSDIVEVITRGGTVGNNTLWITHQIGFVPGQKGMFLCKNASYPSDPGSATPNAQQLMLYDGLYFDFDFTQHYVSVSYANINFDCIERLYQLLDPTFIAQCLGVNPDPVLYAQKYAELENVSIQMQQGGGGTDGTVTYTFENAGTVVVNGQEYFEFDIYMSSSIPVYFALAMLYIDYNSAAFGTNIVAAGGVTVQRGELMNPIFQYENPVAQDILGISNHTLGIIAAQNQDATELHFLDAVSKQLVHVKMKITDCNALPQLYFDQLDISLVGTLYFIVQNPNNDINQGFSQIIATDQENTALCGLSVSSILPSTVNAGKGDVVTVQGSGFGISGTVQMKNADDGGLTWVTLDDYDIVSWTDTEIKIKVPSTLPLTTNTNLRKTVGTGPIRITTGGETVETNQVLTVYYAWKNYQINDNNTTIKGNGLHAGRELVYDADMINQHYGYKLIPNVNFTNTDARDVLAKAMNRWTCESNIRWRFADGESTNIANAQDDLSTIRMGTTSTSNILGETQVFIVRCGGGGGSEIGYVRSFDIVISDAHPFFYDATGLEDTPAGFNDYYSMILHELGHAHLLEHIIDPHDLMYWSLMPNNIEVSSEDRKIDFSQSNIDAAHAIMDESVQTSFGFCTTQDEAHESLVLSDCESANSLTENHFGLPHNLKIIPNPAMDKVDVHFYLKSNHNISLSIHSVQGRLMIRSESIKGQTGDNKVSFDISDLKKGIYFIVLQTQGHGFTSKLVVL